MSATSDFRQAVNASTTTAQPPRKVGALLCFGIAILPFVFSWFVLRKGYSPLSRVVALGWLALFVVIVATAQNPGSTTASTPVTAASPAAAPAAQDEQTASTPSATPAAPDSNWSYSSDRDAMRGTTTRYARVESDNELQFDFPYNGGSRGTLQLRDKAGDLNVILSIDKGQFTCSGIMNQTVAVKFDEGSIQRYACANASDGSSNVLFLMSERRFLKQLRRAHQVIIEAEFFQAGSQQLTFNVARLKW